MFVLNDESGGILRPQEFPAFAANFVLILKLKDSVDQQLFFVLIGALHNRLKKCV